MTATPKKILISGSSGYVGQHLIASLLRHGIGQSPEQCEVYCAYNSLPTFETDLDDLRQSTAVHPSIAKIKAFPLDFQSDFVSTIKQACGGDDIDVIIHLAALSSPFYCQHHEDEAWKINVPIDLLSLNAPIIYMSTDQVYQGTQQYYKENDETLPVNLYGRSKLAFERVLLLNSNNTVSSNLLTEEELGESTLPEFLSTSSLQKFKPHPSSVILRSSLILGKPTPFANGCKKGCFSSFLQFVESRFKSATNTDYFTNEYRSMVHVEDVIRALLHFSRQAILGQEDANVQVRILNLGGSERVSRYDLAMKMAAHLKLDGSCAKGVDRPSEGGGVPSPADISMNVDKLTKELGLDRLDGLDEIVAATF